MLHGLKEEKQSLERKDQAVLRLKIPEAQTVQTSVCRQIPKSNIFGDVKSIRGLEKGKAL